MSLSASVVPENFSWSRFGSALRRVGGLLGLVLAFWLPGQGFAATITSNGTGGGNWTAGTTWQGGTAPVGGDDVVIQAGDTVTYDTSGLTINSLTHNGTNLDVGGNTLTVSPGAASGTGAIGLTGGTFTVNGTIGALTGNGTLTANGALTTGALTQTNQLTLNTGGQTVSTGAVTGAFNFSVGGNGNLTMASVNLGTAVLSLGAVTAGGSTTVSGDITADSITTAGNANNIALLGGGTFTTGFTFSNTGTLTLGNDAGDVINFGGNMTATAPSSKSIAGTLNNSGGSTTNLGTSLAVFTANTLISQGTGALTFTSMTVNEGVTVTLGSNTNFNITINAGSNLLPTAGGADESLVIRNGTGNITSFRNIGAVGNTFGLLDLTAKTGGTVTFATGTDYIKALTTQTAAGTITINASIFQVTNAVDFNNTTAVTLGNTDTDTLTFFGGMDCDRGAGGPATVNQRGILRTAGSPLLLGPLTLTAASTVNTFDTTNNGGTATGGTLTFAGTITGNNRSPNVNAGTAGTLTVANALSAINTWTQNGAATANYQSTVSATTFAFAAANSGTTNFTGAVTLTTLTVNAGAYNINLNGGGTITNAVTFSNTGTLGISAGATFTAGATATAPSSKTLAGTISAAGTGVLNFGTTAATISGSATLGGTSTGAITLAAVTINDGAILTLGAGAATPVNLGTVTSAAFVTGAGLTLNTSGTITPSGSITLTGGLTLTLGTLPLGANALTVGGTIARTSGILTSTGTITLNGISAQSIDFTGSTVNNLTANNTAGTPNITLTNTASFTWNGSLTLTAGTVILPNLTQTIAGTVSGSGGLNASAITGGNTLTVSGSMGTAGTATGTLSAPTSTSLTVGGSWNVTSFTANSGTVVFSAGGTLHSSAAFQNLTLSAGTLVTQNVTLTVGGNLTGAGTLNAAAITGGNSLSVTGTVGTAGTPLGGLGAPASTVTVAGTTWNVTALTHNSGTVLLTGAAVAVVSSNTFFNLTLNTAGQTATFTAGTTTTIAASGTFTVTGAIGAGNQVALRSSVGGSSWNLINNGTGSADWADVKDSNLTVTSITATNSRNSGNNSALWIFSPVTMTWTGAVNSSWTTGGNWSFGYEPNPTDNVTVPNGATNLDLASAAGKTVNDLTITGNTNSTGAASLTLTGNLTISGTVTNTGNTTWIMTGTASPTINSAVSLGSLTVNPGAGNKVLLSTNPLVLTGNLLVTSGSLDLAGRALTLNGTQLQGTVINTGAAANFTAQTGALTLAGATAITTNGGAITFSSTVNGTQTLTLTAGAATGASAGAVSFGAAVGGTTPLGAVTVTGGTFTTASTFSVSTTNPIVLNVDDVVLGGAFGATTSGSITIGPRVTDGSVSYDFDLNDNRAVAAKQLSLSTAELANLTTTGTVTLGANANWNGGFWIGNLGNLGLTGTTYSLVLAGATAGNSAAWRFGAAGDSLNLGAGKNLTLNLGTGSVSSNGTATADVTLTGAGTLTVSSAANVWQSAGPTAWKVSVPTLAAATVTGSLALANAVGLTVSGNLTAAGNSSLTSGAAGLTVNAGLILDAGTGTWTLNGGGGPVNLTTATVRTSNASASAITLVNTTSLALGNVDGGAATKLPGTLVLGSAGNVGAVTQTAATSLNITTLTGSTGSTVALVQAANVVDTLGAAGFTSGGDFSLTSSTALNLAGNLTVTGTAALRAVAGGVSQSAGILTSTGLQLVGAGAFTLNQNNAVSTLALNTSGGAVQFTSVNALALGSVTTNGVTTATVTVTGTQNLSLTAPALTQTAAITAQGLEVKGTLTGAVVLTQSNAVGTLAVATTGQPVSFTASGALAIGTVNTAGISTGTANLTLIAGGAVTQTQAVNVGTGVLTVQARLTAGANITLNLAAGNTAGSLDLRCLDTAGGTTNTAGNLAYTATAGNLKLLALRAGSTSGTIALTMLANATAYTIDQTGLLLPVTAGTAGNLSLTLNNHHLDLSTNGSSNVLTAVTAVSAGSLKLNAGSSYALTALTATGNIDVTGTGGATAVTVNGAVTSSAGNITLDSGSTLTLASAAVPLLGATNGDISLLKPVNLTANTNLRITETDNLVHSLSFASTVNSTTGSSLTISHNSANTKVDTSFAGALGAANALSALTVAGTNLRNLSLASIGAGSAGVTGAINATVAGTITFAGTTYRSTGLQAWTAAAGDSFLFTAGAATTMTTANTSQTFTTGSLKLSAATNLTLTAGSGALSFGAVNGTSAQNFTATTSTSLSAGALGTATANGLHIVALTGTTGITLNGNIAVDNTAANAVTLTGPVVLAADVSITTGGAGTGISATSTINSDNVAPRNLTLDASAGGSPVSVAGIVGTDATAPNINRRLASFTVKGTTLDLNQVFTTGKQDYTATTQTNLNATTYTVTANVASSPAIGLTGPVVLKAGAATAVTLTTFGSANDDVVFSSTVNANAVSAETLTVNAGTAGLVSFGGIVGGTKAPGSLTITQSAKLTFSAAVTLAGGLTLNSSDLDLGGQVNLGNTSTLSIFTRLAGNDSIDIGTAGAGTMQITQAELTQIRNVQTILIGQSGTQSGTITLRNAALNNPVTNLTTLTISSNAGAGGIVLNDSGTGPAFDVVNSGVALTLNSGTGGISATANNAFASLANAGTILLTTNSAGATNLGTAANRLRLASGSGAVRLTGTAGSGSVALRGLGALTLGTGASDTGGRSLDIDTSAGDLTLSQSVTTGNGAQTFSPAGNLNLNFAGSVLNVTTANLTVTRPVILQQNSTVTVGTGNVANTVNFQSTIDSPTTAFSLTVTGAGNNVTFGGAVGANNPLSALTVTSNAVISLANLGTSVGPVAGTTGAVSVTASTTGSVSLTGSHVQAGSTLSLVSGTVGIPRTLTASGALTLRAGTTLTVNGDFVSTVGDATLISNDIALGSFGTWNLGARTLNLQTATATTAMNIGTSTGPATDWDLDDTELARLNNAASGFGKIVFGKTGTQSGSIVINTADLSAANAGAGTAVEVYADVTPATITLNTNSNAGHALNTGTANILLKAFTSILSAQVPNTPVSTNNGLNTTGTISLTTDATSGDRIGSGPVNTFAAGYAGYFPIVINGAATAVSVAGKNTNGVFLMGNGATLALGSTGAFPLSLDLYNNSGVIYLTDPVYTTSGSALSYLGPVELKPSSGTSITLDTSGGNVTFGSTLNDWNSGLAGKASLVITAGAGAVNLGTNVGGIKALGAVTVTGGAVTATALKTSTAGGLSGNVSLTHSGLLTLADATSAADTATADLDLAGSFVESGAGTVTLAGDITTANAGITFNTAVTLNGNVALVSGSGNHTFQTAATVNGAFALTLNGTGSKTLGLALGGTTRLTGLTSIGAGTLAVNADVRTSGAVNLGDTTVSLNSASGPGVLDSAATALTLSNAWNVTQNYTFTAGTITLGAGTLGSGATSRNLTLSTAGGTIASLDASAASISNLTFANSALITVSGALGAVQPLNGLTVSGAGGVAFGSSVAAVSLTQSNGPVTVTGAAFGLSGALTQSGGTFTQTGSNGANVQQVGSIALSAGTMTLDSGAAGGTWVVTGATAVSGTGILDLGKKTATLGSLTTDHTSLAGTGQIRFNQSLTTVSGNLTAVTSAATSVLNFATANVTVNGSLLLNGGASDLTLGSSTLTIKGSSADFRTSSTAVTETSAGSSSVVLSTANPLTWTSHATRAVGAVTVSTPVTFVNGGAAGNLNAAAYSLAIGTGGSVGWGSNNLVLTQDLQLTGSGDLTGSGTGALTIGRDLGLAGTATLTHNTGAFTVARNLTLGGSGTVTLKTTGGSFGVGTAAGDGITWGAGASSTLDASLSTANFTVSGPTSHPATAAGGNFLLGKGRFLLKGAVTYDGTGALTENATAGSSLNVWSDLTLGAAANFAKHANSLLEFGDPTAVTATSQTLAPAGALVDLGHLWVFANAVVTSTGRTWLADTATINGQLRLTAASLVTNSTGSIGTPIWTVSAGGTLLVDSSTLRTGDLTNAGTVTVQSSIATPANFEVADNHVLTNNGTFTMGTATAANTLSNSNGSSAGQAVFKGTDLTKTGNFTLTNFDYQVGFTLPAVTVTLGGATSVFRNVTLNTAGGILAGGSNNFTVQGDWTVTNGQFTAGAGQTVTFDTAAAVRQIASGDNVLFAHTPLPPSSGFHAAGAAAGGKQFSHLAVTGANGIRLVTNDLRVSGNLTLANTAGQKVDLNGNYLSVGGTLTVPALANITAAGDEVLQLSGAVSWLGTLTASQAASTKYPFVLLTQTAGQNLNFSGPSSPNLYHLTIDAPGVTLVLQSDLSLRNLAFSRGTLTTAGHTITTTADAVLLGAAYNATDADRATASPGNTFFQFPGVSSGVGTTDWAGWRAAWMVPAAGYSAAFTDLAGTTLNVGRNFYANGIALTGTGQWTLNLANAAAINADSPVSGSTWNFGSLFAAAFNLTVSNSKVTPANAWVAAAVPSAALAAGQKIAGNLAETNNNVSNGGSNRDSANALYDLTDATNATMTSGFVFVRPYIVSAQTIYDNLLKVTFNRPVLNTGNELARIVGNATLANNLRFSSAAASPGDIAFTGVFTDAAATIPAAGTGNQTVLYFQIAHTAADTGHSWNTDATGTSAERPGKTATTPSTDRWGVHQTTIPALALLKGMLWDPRGKVPAQNLGSSEGFLAYTGATDQVRPVLVQAVAGRAAHLEPTDPSFTAWDAHNYFHLVYSEEVNVADSTVPSLRAATPTATNLRALAAAGADGTGQFGGDLTSAAGTATLAGFLSYAGTITRASRDGNPITNSLDRSAAANPDGPLGLRIFIAGFSTGSGQTAFWPGYLSGVSQPSGTVTVPANAQITDLAGNGLEPTSDPYTKAALIITGSGWDVDPPVIAPYQFTGITWNSTTDPSEVVTIDSNADQNVDRLEFHILDNAASVTGYDSITGNPDDSITGPANGRLANPSSGHGVRYTSIDYANGAGFSFKGALGGWISGTSVLTALNNTGFDFQASNLLFLGSIVGNTAFAFQDAGYFAVKLNQSGYLWLPGDTLSVAYDQTQGRITDLAGNLLASIPQSAPIFTIKKTPPRITLTLAGRSKTRAYVQFSDPVFINTSAPGLNLVTYDNLFAYHPSGAVVPANSIAQVIPGAPVPGKAGAIADVTIVFANPIEPDDLLTATVSVLNQGLRDLSGNYMSDTVNYNLTSLAMDMVTPLWAADGSGWVVDALGNVTNPEGTAHVVRDFTGTEYLTARSIDLQVKVEGTAYLSQVARLIYDLDVPASLTLLGGGVWLPIKFQDFANPPVLPPAANTDARIVPQSQVSPTGDLRLFSLPGSDPKLRNGSTLRFLFQLGSFYAVRSTDATDPTKFDLYSIPLRSVKEQKNGVTVLNNVINPFFGQKAELQYSMARSGIVTVEVFALDGSAVKILHRGRQAAGDYLLKWDGRNESGDPVAVGVYFVRVVAPDIDETRNILVVK